MRQLNVNDTLSYQTCTDTDTSTSHWYDPGLKMVLLLLVINKVLQQYGGISVELTCFNAALSAVLKYFRLSEYDKSSAGYKLYSGQKLLQDPFDN